MNQKLVAFVTAAFMMTVSMLLSGCPAPPPPPKPKPECAKNEDCPEGKECKSGKCVKEKPKAECATDEDCPDPKICRSEKCVYECTTDDDCDEGEACENYRCVEAKIVCDAPTVFFDFDQYYLTSEGQDDLRPFAKCLQKMSPPAVRIDGYCDERGTDQYNLALGDKRAKAVKNFLVEMGISPSVISVVSYGEEYSSRCSSEDCWSKDRKGVIKIEEK